MSHGGDRPCGTLVSTVTGPCTDECLIYFCFNRHPNQFSRVDKERGTQASSCLPQLWTKRQKEKIPGKVLDMSSGLPRKQ